MAAKSLKGFSYEREICHKLSKWWMGDPNFDDVIFWRTAGSGAHATQRAKKGKKTSGRHGDVAAVDERGGALTQAFVLEIKRGYNKNSIHDLLDRPAHAKKIPEDSFADWINKLLDKCELLGVPYWMLIHRRDRREAMVYLPKAAATAMNIIVGGSVMVKFQVGGRKVIMLGYSLNWFLEHVNSDAVRNLV